MAARALTERFAPSLHGVLARHDRIIASGSAVRVQERVRLSVPTLSRLEMQCYGNGHGPAQASAAAPGAGADGVRGMHGSLRSMASLCLKSVWVRVRWLHPNFGG